MTEVHTLGRAYGLHTRPSAPEEDLLHNALLEWKRFREGQKMSFKDTLRASLKAFVIDSYAWELKVRHGPGQVALQVK